MDIIPEHAITAQEGDKLAPLNAQMCIISVIMLCEDLPQTVDKLVPDIVINPNSIQPSRKRNKRNRNNLLKLKYIYMCIYI